MGGKSPKRKGTTFERELVRIALDSGIPARRAYASNGESLGLHADVDLVVGDWKIQAKRRAKIADYMQPTDAVNAVAARADFGDTLIVIRYEDFLDLIRQER